MFKNKKIVLIILLIFIVAIISFFIGTNVINKSIIRNRSKEAEKLTETNQNNSYITTEDHLAELNASVVKLTEFKKEIASAITEMGVATAENADATTMASNIRSISGSQISKIQTINTTLNGGTNPWIFVFNALAEVESVTIEYSSRKLST